MKEATGEVSMAVVTIILIVIVLGIATALFCPNILFNSFASFCATNMVLSHSLLICISYFFNNLISLFKTLFFTGENIIIFCIILGNVVKNAP